MIEKAKKIDSIHKLTGKRQEQWQTQTKDFIYDTLTEISKSLPIETYVQHVCNIINLENVNLGLGIGYSGLRRENYDENNKRTGIEAYIKHLGHIAFCLRTDGKIVVVVSYPYIEKITSQKESLNLGVYLPESITKENIYSLVEKFFDEIIDFENKDFNETIGFRLNRIEK